MNHERLLIHFQLLYRSSHYRWKIPNTRVYRQ